MDLLLKQWRHQHESEQQPCSKIPKLLFDPYHDHQQQQHQSGSSALPLFVPELNSKISTNLSALPDSTSRFSRMGSYFSLAQWQELELQALIYRYMLAGAAVPPELLEQIKKSLLQSPTYFLHHPLQQYSQYRPAFLQSGYWGRAAMDPEPGRCRRTDGKKWRCSRDVVPGQKYCERHLHRGRYRSRKSVEMPTSNTTITNSNATAPFGGADVSRCGALKTSSSITASPLAVVVNGPNNFDLSGPSPPTDLLHLHNSSLESKNEHKGLFEAQNEVDNRSDGHILRHFFDDWPRSLQEPDNAGSPMNSATCLSISMPGNSSSDVSLKLSACIGDQLGPRDSERDQPQKNWATGWATTNQVASMGGPLAEALRSSTSSSSPTSFLHQICRGSASETIHVST